MKTNVRKEGTTVIVRLEGQLDYETTGSFRDSLMRLENVSDHEAIVFDFGDLQFVGSSGISAFVQALRDFNTRAAIRPRYANVRSEFRKIIVAFDELGSFDFDDADKSPTQLDN